MEQFTVNFIDKTEEFTLNSVTTITDHTQLSNIGTKTHATLDSEVEVNNAKVGVTTEEANTIDSEPIGNENQVLQVVSISQANYDLITPVATTFYIIT